MKDNIIFIAGVHGVGKTTICNKIKKEVNLNTYSSSDLIKRYNSSILSEEKQVNDVNDNQDILLKAISKFVDNNEVILLDGHFTLIYSGHTNGFEIFYIDGGYRENESFEQKHLILSFIKNTEEYVRKLEGVKELLLKKLENKNEPLKKVQKQIKK